MFQTNGLFFLRRIRVFKSFFFLLCWAPYQLFYWARSGKLFQDKNIEQLLKLPPGSKQLNKYNHLLLERWQVQDCFIPNVETAQVGVGWSPHLTFQFNSDDCRPMREQSNGKISPANTSLNSQVWAAVGKYIFNAQ